MRFDVSANGHRHAVDAQRVGGQWLVTIDGRRLVADVTAIGARWSLLLRTHDAGGQAAGVAVSTSYDIAIESRGHGERLVHVDGRQVAVTFATSRRRQEPREDAGDGGLVRVVSPMTGRVVKVLVGHGDVVAARQGLVVVEAMKMENEIRAPRGGTVREVAVREGVSVEAGAILVVIE